MRSRFSCISSAQSVLSGALRTSSRVNESEDILSVVDNLALSLKFVAFFLKKELREMNLRNNIELILFVAYTYSF